MDVFIYASPGFGRPRDEIEDAIAKFLGYKGEVTGGGSGEDGSNIDIEVFEVENRAPDRAWIVEGLRGILKECQSPNDTMIVVDGQGYPVYST